MAALYTAAGSPRSRFFRYDRMKGTFTMKKNTIRRLIALALTVILSLSLAACSAGGVPVIGMSQYG